MSNDFQPAAVSKTVKKAAGFGARRAYTRANGPEGWWRTVVTVRPSAGPAVQQALILAGYRGALLSDDGLTVTVDHPRPW